MDGIGGLTFGKGFGSLEKFQKLDFSGMTGNCSFKKISKDMLCTRLDSFIWVSLLVIF